MMQTCLILIILGFTELVNGWDLTLANITYNDSYPVCPVSLFRRKRAHTEYTRWRASLETTPEFLVKVLDEEDLTTPNTRPIVAVNIQPVTRGAEKIIVGGVIVPSVTTTQIIPEGYRNYTRFVPPTTIPVSRVGVDLYLAPQTPSLDVISPIKPNVQYVGGRHSQRDESPPASPQFLPRTVPLYARQYAPIEAVAFTRRPTDYAERKPSTSYIPQRTLDVSTKFSRPTRTSPLPDIVWPQRTRQTFDNIVDLQNLIADDFSEVSVTKTSLHNDPIRTSTIKMDVNEEFPMPSHAYESGKDDEDNKTSEEENRKYEEENKKLDEENRDYEKEYRKSLISRLYEEENRKKQELIMRKSGVFEKNDKDSDIMYSMFYGDEDNDSNKKHALHYDERSNINKESVLTTESDLDDYDKKPTIETSTESEYANEENSNLNQNESNNIFFGVNAELTTPSSKGKSTNVSKRICSLIKLRNLNFNSPHTLAEIQYQLKRWADKSPLVKLEDITEGNLTAMENPIYLMSVDDPSSGQIVSAKQTVMVVAGIQGRDHHAVAAAMYVLYQLIERTETHADLLTKYRFWIIPVFNPDGYDYSMTFPHRREWMKNLRQNWEICTNRDSCIACEQYGLLCTVQPCYGVNLDRNFEYQWIPAEALRAEHPCGSLYAGARQLSEEETRALTQYLHNKRMLLATFIAFKEGEVLGVMYPYSHTRKLRTFDQIYRQRASRAASAAYSINGRPYVAGQTSEFLPLYAGGIEDWVDGHLGIDHTYTIMMFRTTDSYNTKLITERVVHEGFAAMDTLLLQSVTTPLSPPNTLKRANSSPKQLIMQRYIIIFFIALHYKYY